jgi:hypothetical protein
MEPSKFSVSFFVKFMALQILLIDLGVALGPSFFTASLKIGTQAYMYLRKKLIHILYFLERN